jgi:hypothetical protein
MIKKVVLNFLIFAVLILINLFAIYIYSTKNRKLQATRKVLDEISSDNYESKQQFTNSSAPLVLGEFSSEIGTADSRAANLKSFFRKYNSALYDEAEFIVQVSDENQFDYRLIPAIAMQESNLCKYIPDDSYNCWGWGIYGNNVTKFSSYHEAIETVAEGLKKEYIDKGLVRASDIMEKYTPSSNGSWAHGVNTFLGILQ